MCQAEHIGDVIVSKKQNSEGTVYYWSKKTMGACTYNLQRSKMLRELKVDSMNKLGN